jgi:hypothetical protein
MIKQIVVVTTALTIICGILAGSQFSTRGSASASNRRFQEIDRTVQVASVLSFSDDAINTLSSTKATPTAKVAPTVVRIAAAPAAKVWSCSEPREMNMGTYGSHVIGCEAR